MADSKVSALTAAAAALSAMEFPVNDAGVSKKLALSQLATFMSANSGWRGLGFSALGAAAARTGDVIWTGSYGELEVLYLIAGYAGGAVARIITSTGAVSETQTNHCCALMEGATVNNTSINVCGWPTAVTVAAQPRWGRFAIHNRADGLQRRAVGSGQHSGSAPATPPTLMAMGGLSSNTSQIDRVRMTSFSGLTGNTVGSNLNTGSFILVLGRNDD